MNVINRIHRDTCLQDLISKDSNNYVHTHIIPETPCTNITGHVFSVHWHYDDSHIIKDQSIKYL